MLVLFLAVYLSYKYYLYIGDLKDILENFNVGVTYFLYSVIKIGRYSARLLPSSVENFSE